MTRLVFLSDTHGQHRRLVGDLAVPACDVLVHCGDATKRGDLQEVVAFARWFLEQPAGHRIFCPGNHDASTEDGGLRDDLRRMGIYVLTDKRVTLAGLRFHGSPWTPEFGPWSWMLPDRELRRNFDEIRDGDEAPDVLVTHGPPRGVLDRNQHGEPCGSEELWRAVRRVKPRLHAFGHIHEARGSTHREWADGSRTDFLNVANLDRDYRTLRPPVMWDLEPRAIALA